MSYIGSKTYYDKKPRILQVVLDLQFVGEKVVSSLSKAVSEEFTTMFCCLDRVGLLGEELAKEGFFVTFLDRHPGFDYRLPFKIACLARDKRIDIIHAHHYTPFFYSALSRILYHTPRLIFTEHGRDFPDVVRSVRKCANFFLNLVTDRITAVCQNSREVLIKKDKLPASKIDVIYNGIEPIKEKLSSLDEFNQGVLDWIGTSDKVIGFLGRLEWIKNPELLIDAFAKAHKKVPDAKLVIMGRGELMKTLKKRCERHGISYSVLFTGLIKNPMPVLPKIRALAVTSLTEATSLSILEAMMCGIPVIATNVGGNPELVKHAVTGYLVESGNVEAFADAMVKLLVDSHQAQMFGREAAADAIKRFSFSVMVDKYKEIYAVLLNRKRPNQ
ncbi:MAG: glycosyltransferase [Candidatus Hodarchaeota archaeon]